jgi:hypothetical protein
LPVGNRDITVDLPEVTVENSEFPVAYCDVSVYDLDLEPQQTDTAFYKQDVEVVNEKFSFRKPCLEFFAIICVQIIVFRVLFMIICVQKIVNGVLPPACRPAKGVNDVEEGASTNMDFKIC